MQLNDNAYLWALVRDARGDDAALLRSVLQPLRELAHALWRCCIGSPAAVDVAPRASRP